MNEAKKKNYIVNSVYRSFLLVCVLSMVSATLGGLIDNVIVGRFLGTEALGAMGIVSPVMFLFMALGVLCASGGAILVSQALGQGDTARVRNVFSTAVCFDALAGVIVCALGLVFVRPLAALLGARGTLAELSVQYLRGFLFSAPAVIALGVLMQLVQIDGSPRLTLLATVVMTVSDVVFDLLVVVLHAGMLGMALATTLSNYLAVAVLAFHFRKDSCTLKLVRPRSPLRAFRSMALTSLPAVMTVGGDLVRTTILNNWLAAISVAAVAALNVRAQAQNLIGALALEEAPPRFHARLSCVEKTYVYRVWNSTEPNVFERRYVYAFPQALDTDAMRKAASLLLGRHDFAAFCTAHGKKKSTVRELRRVEIERVGDELRLAFTGDGFLYNMVRILTGTLLEVGSGQRAPESVRAALESLDRAQAGFTAPAQGLFLWDVRY